jgi:uncharacterized protein (TIGR03790 family)
MAGRRLLRAVARRLFGAGGRVGATRPRGSGSGHAFAALKRGGNAGGGLPRWRPALALSGLALATGLPGRAADVGAPVAARVLVLANAADPDSLRVARHYAVARAVPEANLIALPLAHSETIGWREFVATLWRPLLARLVRDGWIDAIPMSADDPVGRPKLAVNGHRIEALVVCRGVPLKVEHEAAFFTEVPPFTRRTEFRTNAGAVDAELSLLAQPNYAITALIANPLFRLERPPVHARQQVVRVARLDGPTPADALALVDRALVAERQGLLGRAYVDLAQRDRTGDGWLEDTARQLEALGFDLALDREPATMPATARIDAPVLYFGWYSGAADGPFLLPGFRFAPGAVALHIHSFSAASLRAPADGWTAALVARGVTATVGNVYEPYLQFTHHPNQLLRALVRGASLVEAAYEALPALSWQAIVIGDPLYRPFAVSLEEQLARREELPPALSPYAVLRRMRLLDAAARRDEAMALGEEAQRAVPGLALGVALARRHLEAGNREAAARALGFVPQLRGFDANEWGLAREAAELLARVGHPAAALGSWRTLLATAALPGTVRLAWLPEGIRLARAAGDAAQAQAWQSELAALQTPTQTK